MTGARGGVRGIAIRIATPVAGLFLASGCASYRVPAANPGMAETQRATCEDFARGEVKRLGESVPAALARGLVIGVALDLSWALEAVQYGARPPESAWEESLPRLTVPPGAIPLVSWAVGGSQLARDAARTNEDVYEQAIQRCTAPARLAEQFGHRDARVATSLELLADCYGWQHRDAQAEPLRREAVAIWEAVFGVKDQRVARALDEHARVLRRLHREEEADGLSRRAATIRAQVGREATPLPRPALELTPLSCDSPFSRTLFVRCRDVSGDSGPDPHQSTRRP